MAEHDDDQLIPLRALNAHAFCPRLFWLEERAGLFEANEHTIEGAAAHTRVNVAGGKLTAPRVDADEDDAESKGADEPPWHARSLWLSSTDLGVSGKLDLVEEDAEGAVMPVDTKKGRAPREGGLWPADEVQLVFQALLLREAGYSVTHIAAYYRAERRRVVVELDDERITRAIAERDRARQTLAGDEPPAPLVDSPKCGGCSLNAICQPDEVCALTGKLAWEAGDELRRVVPSSTDAVPAYVSIAGARIGVRGSSLTVTPPEGSDAEKATIGLAKTSHVALIGNAQMSTQAIRACLEAGIPVCFLSTGARLFGVAAGEESRAVEVRIAQFRAHGNEASLRVARVLIADKIANQRTMLRRNADDGEIEDGTLERFARLVDEAGETATPAALLSVEAEAGKRHWSVYSKIAGRDDDAFKMSGRTRRPPRDATNAMISFASGLLVKDCALAVRTAGLDPFLGVFHTPHHGRPSMALDLMEPFRPLIVDSTVLGVIRRREVSATGFVNTGQAVSMTQPTRRALIVAYERRLGELITHPLFGYKISYRQLLAVHARLLARALTGEIPAMASFRTR